MQDKYNYTKYILDWANIIYNKNKFARIYHIFGSVSSFYQFICLKDYFLLLPHMPLPRGVHFRFQFIISYKITRCFPVYTHRPNVKVFNVLILLDFFDCIHIMRVQLDNRFSKMPFNFIKNV